MVQPKPSVDEMSLLIFADANDTTGQSAPSMPCGLTVIKATSSKVIFISMNLKIEQGETSRVCAKLAIYTARLYIRVVEDLHCIIILHSIYE